MRDDGKIVSMIYNISIPIFFFWTQLGQKGAYQRGATGLISKQLPSTYRVILLPSIVLSLKIKSGLNLVHFSGI